MSEDKQVETWKMKKLIRKLSEARGNGTSMISLILPPGEQIPKIVKMLTDEMGTATNIKSRVNKLSVLTAITSTQQKLKTFSHCPPNGLILYCGTILTEDGKEKKVTIDIIPSKPINTSLYMCDNRFHTEALGKLIEDNDKFGFIIMDGNGCLYGTLQGNTRDVIYKFTVDLPKKHNKGGQSAVRFGRLREEKRHNYVMKVAEIAVQMFITEEKINVKGLIMAGSADFKNDLLQSDMFDPRLSRAVLKTLDICYGGELGFNQAIDMSTEVLSNVKLVEEKKMLQNFFDEINMDTGKYCFMIHDTLQALEQGAVETLIVWDNLPTLRIQTKNKITDELKIHYIQPDQEKDRFSGEEIEIVDRTPFVEWLADEYTKFGAKLTFITDRSQEGSQFSKGFGGIGGILRWKLEIQEQDDGLGDGVEVDYNDEDGF